ncbi:MAG TPA: hypothetical protein VGQ75_10395 [Thermoanaerobaculia bacterium]|nr:hypothetical protein [Thermoanaerobaculia bacterium]HEV8608864.1 hypothetical protein [Thermoanaerobaculia bacterium]
MLAAVSPPLLRLSASGPPCGGPLGPKVFRLLPDFEEARIYQTAREFRVRHELAENDVELLGSTEKGELHQPPPVLWE